MNSDSLGKYITSTDSAAKSWLLVQLRLRKLQERKAEISEEEYLQELADIHKALMNLGEWWIGQEQEVF
jgi:predicted house-cleaning noncanonical NTP pyrophosphatase (MazG superfamily)